MSYLDMNALILYFPCQEKGLILSFESSLELLLHNGLKSNSRFNPFVIMK